MHGSKTRPQYYMKDSVVDVKTFVQNTHTHTDSKRQYLRKEKKNRLKRVLKIGRRFKTESLNRFTLCC